MAGLRGHVAVNVNQSASNPPTCFALPGNQGVNPSWSNVALTVHVAVYDNLRVYVGLNGNVNDTVVANIYPSKVCVDENDWAWRYEGGQLVGPSASWSAEVDATSGTFLWNFTCGNPASDDSGGAGSGYVYVGTLDQFHGSDTNQDGYLYLSGTGSYPVDSPIYPDPVRITVPGFMRFLDYYPFAVSHGGSWDSCNRTGGFTQQFVNGAWQDRKNVAAGSGTNHAWHWNGSSWVLCPEIGEK